MTLVQGCASRQPTDNSSLQLGFKGSAAKQFLELLGKDSSKSWLRAIDPLKTRKRSGGGDHQGVASKADKAWIDAKTADGFNLYAITGNAAAIKGSSVKDADITSCPALFVEWDDGADIETQAQRWQELELPEPTLMVATGGKSVHCYWVLLEPMEPEHWRVLQSRLITYCGSDEACKNPSRLMRLPGSVYFDKTTGEPTGQCQIIAAAGHRYAAFDVETCLPPPAKPKPVAAAPKGQFEPRSIEEINAAAEYIPRRKGGEGTYEGDRNALCGCSAALAEAGHPDPDGAALALLGHLWPTETDARQVLATTTTREAKSFWAIAGEHGYALKRSRKTAQTPPPRTGTPLGDPGTESRQQQKAPQTRFTPRPDSKAHWGLRQLGHTKAMACFDRCVEVQAQRERNSLRRRARLLKAAKDLGLSAYINRQEIAQRVLEAKARCSGEGFKPLTAADRAAMPKPVVRWLVKGLIPANDLTIIGGRPKVGKTRVAVAIAAAVLRGEPFLDFPVAASAPPVLLVTDDQSAGDTADMLTALDLWNHPRLIWSEHFRLTETDLQALLDAIKANPGALVVLDSLRSIGRALQHGENDPEIGATLYDLKQAVTEAGGTLLLIHHCNKAADLVGVEALSGHNAIGGAANTVVTLHHCPNDKGQPDKTNPQRRLHSEGRSGENCDVVIDRAGRGAYRLVSTFDHWQQQLSEANKANKLEQLTSLQERVRDALEDSGEWMTRRQVCDAIGVAWTERGRAGEPKNVGRALTRLVELEAAESQRAGIEATFRISFCTQNEVVPVVTVVPPSHANGSQWRQQVSPCVATGDVAPLATTGVATENDCGDRVAPMSPLSPPVGDPPARQRLQELKPATDFSGWSDDEAEEMLRTLEAATTRRAAAAGIAIPEAA